MNREEIAKRREQLVSLLRASQWMTANYLTFKMRCDDDALKRDLHALKDHGIVELVHGLDVGTKRLAENGEVREAPTAIRVLLVRLTTEGRRMKLERKLPPLA